ncbi:MAG: SDR family oxidoreductase [Acidobacteriota bacterium]
MSGQVQASRSHAEGAILMSGGTGFIGTLIAAVLLGRERRRVVAFVREGWEASDLVAQILPELGHAASLQEQAEIFGRLTILPLPATDKLSKYTQQLNHLGVTEIVHCAGSMDYFNTAELEQTNILLTDGMLDLARALHVERFVHVSTAYSSGYIAGPIGESLHGEPASDPTEYTRTKRIAERRVAESGIPYLIIRPSIVIGDSRTGRYSGKQTGLFQYWRGWERLLLGHYRPDLHMVAPRLPVNFVHQDALQNAFQAAYRQMKPRTIINLVSDPARAPTVRALWDIWLTALRAPTRCHYYDCLDDVPLDRIPSRQRAFMMHASVNTEISAHHWDFENGAITRLKRDGLDFADTTLETMAICQARFMDESPRLRAAVARSAAGGTSTISAA